MKPKKPIRWTITAAADEFSLDAKTLTKRLRSKSIVCGDDNRFSTRQIVAAVIGDKEAETIGKIAAERLFYELRNDETRRTRIPLEVVEEINDFAGAFIRQTILGSRLSDEEKRDILAELQTIGGKVLDWKEGKLK